MYPSKKKGYVAYPNKKTPEIVDLYRRKEIKEEPIHTGDYLNINDRGELDRLKAAYQQAFDEGRDEFIFQDKKIVTLYGKYLIEYLNTQNIQ